MKPKPPFNDQPKASILKKSESSKHISRPLFNNDTLKEANRPQLVDSKESLQTTIREELRRMKKQDQGQISYKELGHRLIEEIKDFSDDNSVLSRIIIEFLESLNAESTPKIIQHFKNTVRLLSKVTRVVKHPPQPPTRNPPARTPEEGNYRQLVILTQNLEDSLGDTQRDLKLHKQLLESEKELNESLEQQLHKFQKQVSHSANNASFMQLELEQLKGRNEGLEREIKKAEGEVKRHKINLQVVEERVHCLKVENQSLHTRNKTLEKELYQKSTQLHYLKTNSQNETQTLQKDLKSLRLRHDQLTDDNAALKETVQELTKQNIMQDEQHRQLQNSNTQIEEKLDSVTHQLRRQEIELRKAGDREEQLDRRLHQQRQQKEELSLRTQHKIQVEPATISKTKSSNKMKALEDIQALIRRHKVDQ